MTKKTFDLDAVRAARAEANQEAPVLKFNGDTYTLPVEVPFAIAEAATGEVEDLKKALKSLLGENYEKFESKNPSLLDVQSFFEALPGLYGLENAPN